MTFGPNIDNHSQSLEEKKEYSRLWKLRNPEKVKEYARRVYKKNPEKIKDTVKQWGQNNSGKVVEYKRRWYKKNPAKVKATTRAYRLRSQYGLTPESFEAMLGEQGFTCAICRSTKWGFHGPIVDHDHITGRVRGILCRNCNMAIGCLQDKPQVARNLAAYLESTLNGKEKE